MCESGSHFFVLRDPDNPEKGPIFAPFRCRSWRHAGSCQRFKGAQDFVRVAEGIASRGDRWVYAVPTFDQRRELSEWDVYKDGGRRAELLIKGLRYRYGPVDYVQTWEKHKRTDFPHVNLVIHNDEIWRLCEGDGWRVFRKRLEPLLVQCGFGFRTHVEPLRKDSGLGLAGYLTKLSRELTGAGVKNQVPVNAPPHFRRIRASRGLLPPILRPGKLQGLMIPAKALGVVDLSVEGFAKLIAIRVEQAEKKQSEKQKGVHHGRSKTA